MTLLLWFPSSRPSLLSRDQTWPSSPSPESGMFSQHLSGTRKDRACQNQGSVFNIIMTAVETVIITQNQKVKRRTSLGQVWGEETDPTLSTMPRGYRNPLVFTLGAEAAETVCPNQGSWEPWCWVWGLCGSHPIHKGQASVPGNPISALCLQRVLFSLKYLTSELRVLPWLTCGPFSSLHLVTFTWGQAPLSGLLLCILENENLWRCCINIIAYHMSNS